MLKRLSLLFANTLLTVLILIYLILEELVWERIAEPLYRFLHGLKILQRLESVIHGLNRYTILIVFLLLFSVVEALGVIAFGLFASGLPVIGVVVYAAKIPITALTFWLFKIAKDKLLTFAWFNWCYDGLQSVISAIKNSRIYIGIKTRMHSVKAWVKALFASAPVQRIRALLGFKAN